ncbi:MAG: hypothetical protein AB7G23_08580 [Vicinamibacterales bacterium]
MLCSAPPPAALALLLPVLCGCATHLSAQGSMPPGPLTAIEPRDRVHVTADGEGHQAAGAEAGSAHSTEHGAPRTPGAGGTASGSRVRGLDPAALRLLAAGMKGSPTIRALVGFLNSSDLVVHVDTSTADAVRSRATTRLGAVRPGVRFLRLHVELGRDRDTPAPLALLAHELEHAREIHRARWVVDESGLRRLYRRIGFPSCTSPGAECFETEAALERGRTALRELLLLR